MTTKAAPVYSVHPQSKYFAVRRTGPKGGTRNIAVYEMAHQARLVASTLNVWAAMEVV